MTGLETATAALSNGLSPGFAPGRDTVVSPAPYGAHNWQPTSYDASQGLVFIPAMQALFQYGVDPKYVNRDGAWNVGLNFDFSALPDDRAQQAAMKALLTGDLIAWDPVKQQVRWSVKHEVFWNGGVLSTAGGLVFQGGGDGKFSAYSSKDGKLVWSYDAGVGMTAAPSTYQIDGVQYVAMMVGYGGAAPLAAHFALPNRPRLPGRLLVFKLDGTDTAPAYPATPPLTIDLKGVTSAGNEQQGFSLYHANCGNCHGPNVSGRYLPDLKTSQMILTRDNFAGVVLGGASKSRGMASFAKYLNADQVESIRAYILKEARAAQTP